MNSREITTQNNSSILLASKKSLTTKKTIYNLVVNSLNQSSHQCFRLLGTCELTVFTGTMGDLWQPVGGYTHLSKYRYYRRLLTFVVPIVVPNLDTFFCLLSKGLVLLINSVTAGLRACTPCVTWHAIRSTWASH